MIRVPFATRGDGVRTQACNKLREIYSGLSKLENLMMLDLGGNRLRKMEHLPPNLEKLFLGKNKIERVENVSSLKKLKVLDVQSNRLTSLEPGSLPSQLQELYGAHNAVTDPPPDALKGLSLETVDLSHNRLTSLEVFAGLQLGDLWLSYNGVPSLDAVGCLKDVPLTCLYLDHNPSAPARESHSRGAFFVVCRAPPARRRGGAGCVVAEKLIAHRCAAEPRYANYLRDFFPLLEQLDANYAPARGAAASGIS